MSVLVSKGIGVLLCAAVMLMGPSCMRNSYEVKIAGPVKITDRWAEFNAKPAVKADKDYHLLVLELEPPFKYVLYREGKEKIRVKGS